MKANSKTKDRYTVVISFLNKTKATDVLRFNSKTKTEAKREAFALTFIDESVVSCILIDNVTGKSEIL